MKLDTFVLLLVCVVAACGVTFWLGGLLLATLQIPYAWLVWLPVGIVGYVVWRVVMERVQSTEDDHYDRMDH
ncbi:MAG: hypothetical protein AAFR53_11120 [Pseudomonadota bacterium]